MMYLYINCLAFFILLPILHYDLAWYEYLWLSPIFIYIVLAYIFRNKKQPVFSENVPTASERNKSFLINFFLFVIICCAVRLLGEFAHRFLSLNCIFLIFYFLLVSDLQFQSVGNYILHIAMYDASNRDKLKNFMAQFFKYSIFYILFLTDKIAISDSSRQTILETVLLLYVINIASRLFVFGNMSLLEKMFKIKFYKTL